MTTFDAVINLLTFPKKSSDASLVRIIIVTNERAALNRATTVYAVISEEFLCFFTIHNLRKSVSIKFYFVFVFVHFTMRILNIRTIFIWNESAIIYKYG